MELLFSPFRFKNLTLKNRIVMPSVASFLIEDDGSITDKTIEHYRRRAAGGPAMVIIEACAVSSDGIVSKHQARIDDDRYIEGFSKIAEVIKKEGAIAGIQIHHGGRQISPRVIGQKPLAPSHLPCPTIRGEVRPMSIEDIKEMVKKFGDAAERALQAGFELIEIHGAHGYLINQFLSRFSNVREDEYGGSIEGRSRFAVEVIEEVRRRIGPDFPLSFKISAQEFVKDGLTTEESIEILKILIPAGIDIVQVSAGNDATPEWICQPMFMEKACLSGSAMKIKQALNIPVMTVGRINHPTVAEELLKKGVADLVCIGRGLLADPEMPKKAMEGRLEDIRVCIACNTCMESIFRKGRIECMVNPALGREKEMEIHPAESPKDIMVIGGGPGGLNVAWILALRGHRVSLYEKGPELGGQLLMGSVTSFKKELLNLISFLKNQIKRAKVKCQLNFEVTLDFIKEKRPDVVILATGSVPVVPEIDGIDNPIVVDISEILNATSIKPKKTIVIGGGPTGCEVALHLAEAGSDVTIIEKMKKLGSNMETMTRKVMIQKLNEKGVTIFTETQVKKIISRGVYIVSNTSGEERFVEAERVTYAIGNRAYNLLYNEIRSLGIPVYKIGDCLEPRTAKSAIFEGAIIGRSI